ncbi:GD17922 [Drosophila simulans]|uniref:GD17922 n=1 Tax=Drosophila simulans TaxID=7240 RepID=B4QRT1_DROSI|nr:GD17922 [Drosophila simulans]
MHSQMVHENKLREMEFKLAIANEKLALFDDKIKDKNEIIEALKMSNNVYKSDYKDRLDAQASIIKKLEEELSTLRKEKLNSSQDLETNSNKSKLRSTIFFLKESEKEKKLLISSLEAQIKEKAKTERENSQLIKSLKSQIGDNDEKLKDKHDLIATLEARLKENDRKNIENEHKIL